MVARMPAHIPLPEEIYVFNQLFRNNGYELRVVGGAVRDYLICQYDGGRYDPKDLDLATDATPEQMEEMFLQANIISRPQGEAFGVMIVRDRNSGREYEIATYRRDGEYTDGRRPDSVTFSTAEDDYYRRDFTINGLFYIIPPGKDTPGQVVDYGDGQGFEDVKAKRVRAIGDAFDRFEEDKLRVLRAVRFHTRYNDDFITAPHALGDGMLEAIERFKDVRALGVSGPRIYQEFVAGFNKCRDVRAYLWSYEELGLFPTVFPGLQVDISPSLRLHSGFGLVPVLAWILRKNDPKLVRRRLNELSFPNEVADEVAFLLRVWNAKPEELPYLTNMGVERRLHLQHFRTMVGEKIHVLDPQRKTYRMWTHFVEYYPPHFGGEAIMREYGVEAGPEVGKIQRNLLKKHYDESYKVFDDGC